MADELSDILRKHAHLFDNQAAYAKALGIDVGRLNRLLNRKGPYSLNALNCLRFAKLTGESPSAILRVAGKGELALLIETLYGEVDSTINSNEREHLRKWRSLDEGARKAIETLMRELPEDDAEQKPAKRKKTA